MEEKKYKILYIDDEVVNLRLFKSSFRRDFDILIAQSAKEGLEILENEKIDVLITDQLMPKMTGVELLKVINEKYPKLPPNRMIVSGYSSNKDIEKAFKEYKLHSFITKPWNYKILKETIINAAKNGRK